MIPFFENLLYLCKTYNVTQSLLSEEIGLPHNGISSLLHKDKLPNLDIIQKIVVYFKSIDKGKHDEAWFKTRHLFDSFVTVKNNPLDWQPKTVKKKRTCLKCDKKFLSHSSANRRCERCDRKVKYEDKSEERRIVYHRPTG